MIENMRKTLQGILLAISIIAATGLISGCATNDPNDLSAQPWDKSQHMDRPLPSSTDANR
jgi:hypothetical protein